MFGRSSFQPLYGVKIWAWSLHLADLALTGYLGFSWPSKWLSDGVPLASRGFGFPSHLYLQVLGKAASPKPVLARSQGDSRTLRERKGGKWSAKSRKSSRGNDSWSSEAMIKTPSKNPGKPPQRRRVLDFSHALLVFQFRGIGKLQHGSNARQQKASGDVVSGGSVDQLSWCRPSNSEKLCFP